MVYKAIIYHINRGVCLAPGTALAACLATCYAQPWQRLLVSSSYMYIWYMVLPAHWHLAIWNECARALAYIAMYVHSLAV
jgi:hypothetical protein